MRLVWLLGAMRSLGGVAAGTRRSGDHVTRSISLSLEQLEYRRLLTATVGHFERDGGLASAGTIANAWIPSEFVSDVDSTDDQAGILADSASSASVLDDVNAAHAQQIATGQVLTPMGVSLAAPYVHTAVMSQLLVKGDNAEADTIYNDGASANGDFVYHADPQYMENLRLHVHIFVAAFAGELEVNASVLGDDDGVYVTASAPGGFAEITSADGEDYYWTATLPSGRFSGFGEMGVNRHFYYSIPWTDGSLATLQSNGHIHADAVTGGGLGIGNISTIGASWFFVSADASGPGPGDFNGDGVVNGGDYELWLEGSPMADGDLDGDIDVNDYEIWSNNADGLLVSTALDESDGNYSFGDLSLREAILLAAGANRPGSDVIAFHSSVTGQTISLKPALGSLVVGNANPIEVLGPGANELHINGNGTNGSIILVQGGGPTPIHSGIYGLHLHGTGTNGTAVTHSDSNTRHSLTLHSLVISGNGWGVKHSGSGRLDVRNTTISNNYWDGVARTTHSPPSALASVSINDSIVADNGANGIALRSLPVEITRSEVFGNGNRIAGKGISYTSDDSSVTLTLSDSTVADNSGGGIAISHGASASLRNATISANGGVGIVALNSIVAIVNSTIADNHVNTIGSTSGIYSDSGGNVELHNVLVADNFSGPQGALVPSDLGRSINGAFNALSSYNLIGVAGNSGITGGGPLNNIVLGPGGNPGIHPLDNYGGITRTHALASYSPAIDAGSNERALALAYDQRGFERIVDWDDNGDALVDIGAFELALSEMYL
ncbi:MAG: hypothetical protein DCC67_04510 [Planctomycetota bacterium]|nr:MAG: hypothetical protein DCC67_04510 [Planctomycetota bacterium]